MKKHHTTIALVILFFTLLITLWWANYAEIPTADQQRELVNRVLPEVIDTPVAAIQRIEVVPKEGKPIVVERRGHDQWQMLEPIDTAANPSLVETLVTNLKDLRKSPDSGTIHEPSAKYGLAPPAATIKLFGKDQLKPLAALELGKSFRDRRYVRELGVEGIEVVDARLLGAAEKPAAEWRDTALFSLPTFRVGSVAVTGPGRDLVAEREEGRWELRKPVRAPAADEKIEEALAELTSLRVIDGAKGFVADNVKDYAPYGLDTPRIKVVLTPGFGPGKPQTLLVGKDVPDVEDRVYARRGDQDDVVMVDARGLRDLGLHPVAYRSQKVADISPSRVNFVELRAFDETFRLARAGAGWELLKPTKEKAEPEPVQALLTALNEVKTSEFLTEAKVGKEQIEPPSLTIKVWQSGPVKPARGKPNEAKPKPDRIEEPEGKPAVDLEIGRHDVLKKVIYARLKGDESILALPETFLQALPESKYAFRDHTVLSLSATQVERLKVIRHGRVFELAPPSGSGAANQWRMRAPVDARADNESVTQMIVMLSGLRADGFVNEPLGDGKAFGLDDPWLSVSWTLPPEATGKGKVESRSGTLRIGSKRKPTESYYANIAGQSLVFTLSPTSVQPFLEEFHDRRVLSFKSDQVERVLLRWPARSLSFVRQPKPVTGPFEWKPELGQDISGFDLSRVGSLVKALAELRTDRFTQYKGSITPAAGLNPPRLLVEVQLAKGTPSHVLRLGNTAEGGAFYGTTTDGLDGPVFLVSGVAWTELAKPPRRADDLPEDVFGRSPLK